MCVSSRLTIRVEAEVVVVDVGVVDIAVYVDVVKDLRIALVRANPRVPSRKFPNAKGSTNKEGPNLNKIGNKKMIMLFLLPRSRKPHIPF